MKKSNAFISASSDFMLLFTNEKADLTINPIKELPDDDDEPIIVVPPKKIN